MLEDRRRLVSVKQIHVFDVLDGSALSPNFVGMTLPLLAFRPIWKKFERENLFSILYFVTNAPAAALVRQSQSSDFDRRFGRRTKGMVRIAHKTPLYVSHYIVQQQQRGGTAGLLYEQLAKFRMEQRRDPDDCWTYSSYWTFEGYYMN